VVREVIRKAFNLSEYEKPGTTHVELSEDLAKQEAKNLDLFLQRVCDCPTLTKAINRTIELLKEAKRQLIITGNGAIRQIGQ
jgi:acetolactate synthase-1/2/3 large subunit